MSDKYFVLVRRPPRADHPLPEHKSYGPFTQTEAGQFCLLVALKYMDALAIVEPLRDPNSL